MTFWFGYQMSGRRTDNTNAIDTVSLCYVKTSSVQKKWYPRLWKATVVQIANSTTNSKATSVLKAQWHCPPAAGCLCLLTDIVYTASLLLVSSVSNLMHSKMFCFVCFSYLEGRARKKRLTAQNILIVLS